MFQLQKTLATTQSTLTLWLCVVTCIFFRNYKTKRIPIWNFLLLNYRQLGVLIDWRGSFLLPLFIQSSYIRLHSCSPKAVVRLRPNTVFVKDDYRDPWNGGTSASRQQSLPLSASLDPTDYKWNSEFEGIFFHQLILVPRWQSSVTATEGLINEGTDVIVWKNID